MNPKPWEVLFLDFGDDFCRGSAQCGDALNQIFNSTEKYVHLASRQCRIYRKKYSMKRAKMFPFTSEVTEGETHPSPRIFLVALYESCDTVYGEIW